MMDQRNVEEEQMGNKRRKESERRRRQDSTPLFGLSFAFFSPVYPEGSPGPVHFSVANMKKRRRFDEEIFMKKSS